jgi:hypothetical protein
MKAFNSWKKIIVYGVVSLFIFSLSLILIVTYNFYVLSLDRKKQNVDESTFMNCEQANKTKFIERIGQLRTGYKIGNEKNPHIFLFDIFKIDKCKYIMVHSHIEGDTRLAFIHANDCSHCSSAVCRSCGRHLSK